MWILFVVSVTRQKEAARCKKYHDKRKRLTGLALYASVSPGMSYSSSSLHHSVVIHSGILRLGSGWSHSPHTPSPKRKSVGRAIVQYFGSHHV